MVSEKALDIDNRNKYISIVAKAAQLNQTHKLSYLLKKRLKGKMMLWEEIFQNQAPTKQY